MFVLLRPFPLGGGRPQTDPCYAFGLDVGRAIMAGAGMMDGLSRAVSPRKAACPRADWCRLNGSLDRDGAGVRC